MQIVLCAAIYLTLRRGRGGEAGQWPKVSQTHERAHGNSVPLLNKQTGEEHGTVEPAYHSSADKNEHVCIKWNWCTTEQANKWECRYETTLEPLVQAKSRFCIKQPPWSSLGWTLCSWRGSPRSPCSARSCPGSPCSPFGHNCQTLTSGHQVTKSATLWFLPH